MWSPSMKTYLRAGVLLLVAAVSLNILVQQAQVQAQANVPGRPGMAEVLESVTPAVVNIAVRSQSAAPSTTNPLLNDPFFRRFFNIPEGQIEPRMRETQSVGSGVIIDADKGYILTNHHVVDKAT